MELKPYVHDDRLVIANLEREEEGQFIYRLYDYEAMFLLDAHEEYDEEAQGSEEEDDEGNSTREVWYTFKEMFEDNEMKEENIAITPEPLPEASELGVERPSLHIETKQEDGVTLYKLTVEISTLENLDREQDDVEVGGSGEEEGDPEEVSYGEEIDEENMIEEEEKDSGKLVD